MPLNYDYKGALEPVNVKVVQFHCMADFIFSFEQWEQHGGYKGLIKMGAFHIMDVEKVITGKMNPVEFDNLPEWDG